MKRCVACGIVMSCFSVVISAKAFIVEIDAEEIALARDQRRRRNFRQYAVSQIRPPASGNQRWNARYLVSLIIQGGRIRTSDG